MCVCVRVCVCDEKVVHHHMVGRRCCAHLPPETRPGGWWKRNFLSLLGDKGHVWEGSLILLGPVSMDGGLWVERGRG